MQEQDHCALGPASIDIGAAGCDALSVHLIVTNLAGSLGMGLGWRATLFSVGVMGPWALAHWEEYHSGMFTAQLPPSDVVLFMSESRSLCQALHSLPFPSPISI